MKQYLYDYIEEVEGKIKKEEVKKLQEEMLVKISFFQHERLIHLIVTIFYALIFIIFMALISLSVLFVVPCGILMIFLIFYIIHYFRLENGVQYLYKLYDKIDNMTKKEKK